MHTARTMYMADTAGVEPAETVELVGTVGTVGVTLEGGRLCLRPWSGAPLVLPLSLREEPVEDAADEEHDAFARDAAAFDAVLRGTPLFDDVAPRAAAACVGGERSGVPRSVGAWLFDRVGRMAAEYRRTRRPGTDGMGNLTATPSVLVLMDRNGLSPTSLAGLLSGLPDGTPVLLNLDRNGLACGRPCTNARRCKVWLRHVDGRAEYHADDDWYDADPDEMLIDAVVLNASWA